MKNGRKVIWGGLLIFLSIYMVAESFYGFKGPSVYSLGLTVFLGLYALTKLFDRNFVEAFMGLGFIGVINFNYFGFQDGSRWTLFAASFLMGLGLQMIFKKKRSKFTFNFNGNDFNMGSKFDEKVVDVEVDIEDHVENDDYTHSSGYNAQDFITAETNFSDQKRYIRSENFTHADLESNFGNLEVYFQGCTFNPIGSTIQVESNFGNVTLYFPRTVNVENRLRAALGSVTGDSMYISADNPTVVLEGTANFGKISVRYL